MAIVVSIAGIELMLSKNSITGVYSLTATGQLIPLIIGIGTVAKLTYNAITEGYAPPRLIWGFMVCIPSLLRELI